MSCNNVQILNFNHNIVEVGSDNKLIITDNVRCNSITIPQPVTNILQINSPGPQGPQGIPGASVDTGSLLTTASVVLNTITFTKGNGSTFPITVNTGSGGTVSGDYVTTSSFNTFTSSYNTFSSSYNTGSFSGSFTGSLQGTASWAYSSSVAISSSYATSASYADTASLAPNYVLNSATSSFVTNNQTSSFVTNSQTSSFVTNSQTSSFVTNSQTSSFITNSQTSSMTVATASYVTASAVDGTVTSASYALTASYAMNGGSGTPGGSNTQIQFNANNTFSGSPNFTFDSGSNTVQLSGSLIITGSISMSGSSFISGVDYIDYDTTATNAGAIARLKWNDTDGTLDLGLKGGNVTLQIGQEQLVRVVNKTGTNLTEAGYQAVRVSGAQGGRLKVALARGDNDGNSLDTLGLVTENIAVNQEGFVTISGLVRGINTTGNLQGETWADGDDIYVSPTTFGGVTNIPPTAPSHSVRLGYIVQSNASNGSIFVKVDNGYEIGELHNIVDNTTTSSYGDLLVKSGSVWTNSKQLTGSYGLTGSLTVTQNISASSFTGSLQGTASWATNAVTASEVLVTDTTTGTSYYVTFVDGTTADRVIRVDSNGLLFNATTNTLTVTSSFATTASYALTAAGGTGGISQGKVVAIATGNSNIF